MKASSAVPVFFVLLLLFSVSGQVAAKCKKHEPMPNCEEDSCQSFCNDRPEGRGSCSDPNTCRCEFLC
ncbi:hypothetical protein H6P81_007357 [Aristolochia fimbriata]|uniref:Uncharacterized protein n=1 Tax=Aristolochia fimbriata TaxID=158543 RepID=A0AAV7F099_ARIFI|nr:hypothetical protein H6P81_007357 [Aristolochia fimbriata]